MKTSQAKAVAKYDKANTKSVFLKLNIKTDKDILDQLDKVGNKQGYIKSLIRSDIAEDYYYVIRNSAVNGEHIIYSGTQEECFKFENDYRTTIKDRGVEDVYVKSGTKMIESQINQHVYDLYREFIPKEQRLMETTPDGRTFDLTYVRFKEAVVEMIKNLKTE